MLRFLSVHHVFYFNILILIIHRDTEPSKIHVPYVSPMVPPGYLKVSNGSTLS